MPRQLDIPDNPAIISAQTVVEVMQDSGRSNQEDLARSLIEGSVMKYHPDQDQNLLAGPGPMSESVTTRTSIPYNNITDGTHTYRVWRTGKVEGQGSAPPVSEYPPVAEYLLSNRWPFSDGSTVVVSGSGSTSVSSQDVSYWTGSGALTFDVSADYIRSDETLRCIVAVEAGSDTLSASLDIEHPSASNEQIASASQSISPSGWSVFTLDLTPSNRVPYGHDPVKLTVDAGALTYTRPVLRPARQSLAPSHFPLPDGRALVRVSQGIGWTTRADRFELPSAAEMQTDLGAGRAFVVGLLWPTAQKKRAVVTGEDRTETHRVEHNLVPRLWTTESLPGRAHLPLARLSAQ